MAYKKRKDLNGRVLPNNVTHRADGRYLYRTQLYGKSHYIYDKDLDRLKEKILEFEYSIKSGKVRDIGKLSLDEWYPQYVEIYKKDKVKDTTLQNYINYYKWYVKGSIIGRMPMRDIKRTMAVSYFRELASSKNLAKSTLKGIANKLYNACQQALYDGVITLNPFENLMKDVKAAPKSEKDALSEEELKLMFEYIQIKGSWQNVYEPLIGIFLGTGCRFGELSGLTWSDVDMDERIIDINHSINYRDRGNGIHEFFITSPKTPNAVRQIPMSVEVYELFKKQKKYQQEMRIRNDITIDGYRGFVFTTRLGNPFTHEGIMCTLKTIIKRANEWEQERAKQENRKPVIIREHTPHIWRHTFTTELVRKDITYEGLKLLLGHSSIRTTIDIYDHCKGKDYKRLVDDVNGIFDNII